MIKQYRVPSDKQKNACQRNWALRCMRGNVAIWNNTCRLYGLSFNKEETEVKLLKLINKQYGFKKNLGVSKLRAEYHRYD